MLVVSRKMIVKDIAEKWKNQNYLGKKWRILNGGINSKDLYKKLVDLGENPNPDDVDMIIGNKGWTSLVCGDCMKFKDKGVLFGRGNHSLVICYDCLKSVLYKFFK